MADTVINKGDNEGGSTVVQPSKVLIPLSTQNQKNRGNLGMKSMWCGCFGHREKENSPHKSLLNSTDAQLLPSCAVQCLIKSDNAESFHGGDALSGGSNASVELPSSVLVTNSLLLAANQTSIAGSDRATNEDKRMNVLWRNLKFTLRKSSFHQKQVPSPKAKVGIPPENSEKLEETPPLNEALVFSPLPSQKVPEIASGPHHAALLGPRSESDKGKKCFVIDLDETLVHSSFKVVENADFKVGVEIDGVTHRVYVLKRPHVDTFLSTMANLYECVLFTASLAKYADPVADFLDQWNAFRYRLFRESCVYHRGNYVKDLSHLGRPINQIVILDNSPASYMFHANHAVQISSWFDDDNDTALLDLIPYFERLASHPNVVDFLRNNSPPTPHAAVGTVGLPISPLASLPPAQDLSGRSPDGLIANLRRPGVVSPMQHCTPNNRSVARYVPLPISETQARLETEKTSPVPHPIGHTRFISPNAVPIITKLASPSSGPSVNPSHNAHDLHTPFPAPLSVAASVPVLPDESIPITATGQLTGDVSQVRLGSYAGSPTPNIVSPHLATPSCSPSPSLTLSYSNPINITSLFSNSLNRKDFTSDLHTRPSPPTPDQQCDSIPLLSHCSSWGENHCIPPSVDPQQVTSGTKSPDSTLHVGTSIPTTSPRSVT